MFVVTDRSQSLRSRIWRNDAPWFCRKRGPLVLLTVFPSPPRSTEGKLKSARRTSSVESACVNGATCSLPQRHLVGSSPSPSRVSFTASSKLADNTASRCARAAFSSFQWRDGFFKMSIVLSKEIRPDTRGQTFSDTRALLSRTLVVKTAGVSFASQTSYKAAAAESLPRLQSQAVSISTKGCNSGFTSFSSRSADVNSRAGNETSSCCSFSKSATSNLLFAEPNTSDIRRNRIGLAHS